MSSSRWIITKGRSSCIVSTSSQGVASSKTNKHRIVESSVRSSFTASLSTASLCSQPSGAETRASPLQNCTLRRPFQHGSVPASDGRPSSIEDAWRKQPLLPPGLMQVSSQGASSDDCCGLIHRRGADDWFFQRHGCCKADRELSGLGCQDGAAHAPHRGSLQAFNCGRVVPPQLNAGYEQIVNADNSGTSHRSGEVVQSTSKHLHILFMTAPSSMRDTRVRTARTRCPAQVLICFSLPRQLHLCFVISLFCDSSVDRSSCSWLLQNTSCTGAGATVSSNCEEMCLRVRPQARMQRASWFDELRRLHKNFYT